MGTKQPGQALMWVPHTATKAPGHRFYEKLNELLAEHGFDRFVEKLCAPYYAARDKPGRRSLPPGVYFRMLLIGYFEGIESERGICWRCADSLSLRAFLGLELTDSVPEHSTLSRIRSRFDLDVYEEVFRFVLGIVETQGLLRGKVVGVDSTYLRADASMKTIVRRDSGQQYDDYLKRLAQESGIDNPTAEDARRMDRTRKKKTSNADWVSKTDDDARITRLKDGRARLGYKPEHVTDLETGAILAAPVYHADVGDAASMESSLDAARENVLATVKSDCDDDEEPPATGGDDTSNSKVEVVGDKGYHKGALLVSLEDNGFRPNIPERKQHGRRRWKDKDPRLVKAVMNNRARSGRAKAKAYHRLRGELVERTFAHVCETGAHRRTRLRGLKNMSKRYAIQAAAANLGLVFRTMFGWGTPRQMANKAVAATFLLWYFTASDTIKALLATWGREIVRILAAAQSALHAPDVSRRWQAVYSTGC